ncbi:PA2928 family protein [Saccharothrix obliqua]|uniref:PA2928 family protein n=1 Tax=Saccharothrix obliqua TaxID=2861747 RepID=UPI001C5F3230|nr:PA2928 family protein [Saccharothrix obliqua]MBW4717963.1 PQQ-binding-like beta-propeller repeat protein [Saccharothrix obliqua]
MKIPYGEPVQGTPSVHFPVAPYETPRRRSPGLLVLAPVVLFALLFFGGSYLAMPEPTAEAESGIGFAAVDGREVVLTPYRRDGARGMFQLVFRDMFQVRLAALDVASGARLWDVQLSDELVWEAAVLAAGDRYAYVATEDGLVILDVRDGSRIAQHDGIDGLRDSYVAARWAYRFDRDNHRVMAMAGTGQVFGIPLDSATATPVEPETAARWAGLLTAGAQTPRRALPSTRVEYAGGQVELAARPDLGPGQVLVKVAPDGGRTPVGGAVFHNAAIVPTGTGDRVLVVHHRGVNDTGRQLSAVDLADGRVTGAVPLESASAGEAAASPRGTTAIGVGGVVATLAPDGRLTAIRLGDTDFFGSPSGKDAP